MEQLTESPQEKMYELTAFVRSEESSAVKNFLAKYHVSMIEERSFVKTHLSYPVKKEHFAFQGVWYFTAPQGIVASLENDLNLESQVLRFIIRSVTHVGGKPDADRTSGLNREARRLNVSREGRKPEGQALTNEAREK